MEHYYLKEGEWQYIYKYLLEIPHIHKGEEKDLGDFIEGVFLP